MQKYSLLFRPTPFEKLENLSQLKKGRALQIIVLLTKKRKVDKLL